MRIVRALLLTLVRNEEFSISMLAGDLDTVEVLHLCLALDPESCGSLTRGRDSRDTIFILILQLISAASFIDQQEVKNVILQGGGDRSLSAFLESWGPALSSWSSQNLLISWQKTLTMRRETH